MRQPYLFASLLLLTACVTDAEREAELARQEAEDHQRCVDLGFEAGTEAYGNCRLEIREIRAQESEKAAHRTSTHIGVGVSVGF